MTHHNDIRLVVWSWLFTIIPSAMLIYLWLAIEWQYTGHWHTSPGRIASFLLCGGHLVYVLILGIMRRPLTCRYAVITFFTYVAHGILYLGDYHQVIFSNRIPIALCFLGPTYVHCLWILQLSKPFRKPFLSHIDALRRIRHRTGLIPVIRWPRFLTTAATGFGPAMNKRFRTNFRIEEVSSKFIRTVAFGFSLLYVDYRLIFDVAFGSFGNSMFGIAVLNAVVIWWPDTRNRIVILTLFSLSILNFSALLFSVARGISSLPHNVFVVSAIGPGALLLSFPLWFLTESYALMNTFQRLRILHRRHVLAGCITRGIAVALLLNSPYIVHIETSARKFKTFCISISNALATFA